MTFCTCSCERYESFAREKLKLLDDRSGRRRHLALCFDQKIRVQARYGPLGFGRRW